MNVDDSCHSHGSAGLVVLLHNVLEEMASFLAEANDNVRRRGGRMLEEVVFYYTVLKVVHALRID